MNNGFEIYIILELYYYFIICDTYRLFPYIGTNLIHKYVHFSHHTLH